MRITTLNIENFGPFADWSPPGDGVISPRLTVIQGRNEAGKSAIRAFIRMVLFGFLRKNAKDYDIYNFPPHRGGAASGSISLRASDGGSYTIYRREGPRGGPVTVTGDEPGGEELLARLIGRITHEVYQNVLSVSLTEVQTFESLRGEQVRDWIFSASLGVVGPVSLPEAAKALNDERSSSKGLWSQQRGTLREALRKLNAQQSEIGKATDELARYEGLTSDIAELRHRIEQLEERLQTARASEIRLKTVNELRPRAMRKTALEADIAALPERENFPEDGVSRLDKLRSDLDAVSRSMREGNLEADEARSALGELDIVDAFARHDRDVQTLRGERTTYANAVRDVALRENEARETDQQIATGLNALGDAWDAQKLEAFVDLEGARSKVRSVDETLSEKRIALGLVRQKAENTDRYLAEAKSAESSARHTVESMTDVPEQSGEQLQARQDRIERLHEALVERETLEREDAVSAMSASGFGTARTERAYLPAGLFLAGVVAAAVSAAVGEVTAVVFGALVAVAGVGLLLRSLTVKPRRGDEGGILPSEMLGEVQNEVAEISKELGLDSELRSRDVVELRNATGRAIKRRDEYERAAATLREATDGVQEATASDEIANENVKSAAQARDQASAAWREALRNLELTETLDPLGAASSLESVNTLQEKQRSAQGLRARIADMRETVAGIELRLGSILESAGMRGFDTFNAGPALDELDRRFRRHETTVAQAGTLRQQLENWSKHRGSLEKEEQGLEDGLRALFAAGRCANEESFRSLAAALEKRARLEHDLAQLLELHPALAATSPGSIIAETDSFTFEDVEAQRQTAGTEVKQLELEITQVREQLFGLEQNRKEAEQSNPVAAIQTEIDELEQRVNEDARRWAVLTIAKHLLDATRDEYQSERQAPLMQLASDHFRHFTNGAYSKVETVIGEEQIRIVEPTGRVKDVRTELSRGTAEQLYLSMRFALIDEYAQHSEPMPVLMDDVMVNFDPERAAAVCESVVELAERHQVLVLTCHPETVAQLRRAAASCGKPDPAVISL